MTDHPPHPATIPGYIHDKDGHLTRRRIEDRSAGCSAWSRDTYCIDVLTQISAATKALEAVARAARRPPAPLHGPRRRRPRPPRREAQRGLLRHRQARPILITNQQHPKETPQ